MVSGKSVWGALRTHPAYSAHSRKKDLSKRQQSKMWSDTGILTHKLLQTAPLGVQHRQKGTLGTVERLEWSSRRPAPSQKKSKQKKSAKQQMTRGNTPLKTKSIFFLGGGVETNMAFNLGRWGTQSPSHYSYLVIVTKLSLTDPCNRMCRSTPKPMTGTASLGLQGLPHLGR